MNPGQGRLPRPIIIAAVVALAFGALTIAAGGRALFGPAQAQAAVGNYVPFVLWFNFIAGFFYLLCGLALLRKRRQATWLAIAITASTLLVACGFVWHVAFGGAYEARTAIALVLRIAIWSAITTVAIRQSGASRQASAQ